MITPEDFEAIRAENVRLREENAQLRRPMIDADQWSRDVLKRLLREAYFGSRTTAAEDSSLIAQAFDRQVNCVLAWFGEDAKKAMGALSDLRAERRKNEEALAAVAWNSTQYQALKSERDTARDSLREVRRELHDMQYAYESLKRRLAELTNTPNKDTDKD